MSAAAPTHVVPSKWSSVGRYDRKSKACREAQRALSHISDNTRARVLVGIAESLLVEVQTRSTGASRLVEVVLCPGTNALRKVITRGGGYPSSAGLVASQRLPKRWREAYDRRWKIPTAIPSRAEEPNSKG